MRIDGVVINASPLITLFRSGQADLLSQLFGKIVVPGAVWSEVVADERDGPAARHCELQRHGFSSRFAIWDRSR